MQWRRNVFTLSSRLWLLDRLRADREDRLGASLEGYAVVVTRGAATDAVEADGKLSGGTIGGRGNDVMGETGG